MHSLTQSEALLSHNSRFIPGGVVSTNRNVEPHISFARAQGSRLWDVDGNEYIDYHAAFAPYILGHNDPSVNAAVRQVLEDQSSLYGSGTTRLEGHLAELICSSIPHVESIQVLNTGSEATYQAIRLARAATGRDHILKPQGGYHGWHNDVACNLMTPRAAMGPRVSPGEYPFLPISAGIPKEHAALVHPINFNDLDSVDWACRKYPIGAMILEPLLQNIGVVHPQPGYLEGLRELADRHGFLLIFDEVKTGFRHALGGYASLCGVTPDLVVYGKAVANGYPIAILGGKKQYMDLFVAADGAKRVLLAGTYNAHPVPTAASIATVERLASNNGEIYTKLEALGARLQSGMEKTVATLGIQAKVARQGSALCLYFMDHVPVDWHDLIENNNMEIDAAFRLKLIEAGIYVFPLATKQWSISAAHTEADIDRTVAAVHTALQAVLSPA